MATITVGRLLDHLRVYVVADSWQSFGLDWNLISGAPASLTGLTCRLELTDGTVWPAVVDSVAGTTTWTLTQTDTARPKGTIPGRLVLLNGTDQIVAFAAEVLVQR